MKVTVCIGSSCHLKGSHQIMERLQELVKEYQKETHVELSGVFCMKRCEEGVCVMVDHQQYSVFPDTVDQFFQEHLLPKMSYNQ